MRRIMGCRGQARPGDGGGLLARESQFRDLLERCRKQEDGAWGEMVDDFSHALSRTARRLGTPDQDLGDIVQECWAVVLRNLAHTSEFSQVRFWSWLRKIAEFVVARYRRTENRWPRLESHMADQEGDDAPDRPETGDGGSSARRSEAAAALRAFLERMPPRRALVFYLHGIGNLTCGEIAAQAGGKESTIRATLRDGFRQIRAEMDDESNPAT